MKLLALILVLSLGAVINACSTSDSASSPTAEARSSSPRNVVAPASSVRADVRKVSVSGTSGAYTFSVTVASSDTGCDQYSDWWEVISSDGRLLHRRVLLHSHVGEQPFTRSGGPVNIHPDETVIVRAHMNTTGYSGTALQGSVAEGFEREVRSSNFPTDLESQGPKPTDCAF